MSLDFRANVILGARREAFHFCPTFRYPPRGNVCAKAAADVSIRPALPEDASFLKELARRVFLAYGSYDEYLEDWFRNEAVSTYVAEVESEPAGFMMLARYPDREDRSKRIADLLSIAVVPEVQSRGVGKALLRHAIALARTWSASELRLAVAEGNARAQRLFARSGFRPSQGVGLYPAGQRALQMIKVLGEKEGV